VTSIGRTAGYAQLPPSEGYSAASLQQQVDSLFSNQSSDEAESERAGTASWAANVPRRSSGSHRVPNDVTPLHREMAEKSAIQVDLQYGFGNAHDVINMPVIGALHP
jgi:hypothetical protein